ncbi:hypothetical protein UA08_04449 [Talaromyces atroroseus]|uniref:Enoyl reductase (ER) domain-containing protein n=1 Tax=Talaromyces atroroseus TaxID=1441469 RepID=A0A1Q5Q8G3_TALAT|nr:hypothetical protein UA08_04449 [Talaromyces atroroseus]OKL60401.1 hypothetical protein UA08_04449 [Talaromyces atroroseus]
MAAKLDVPTIQRAVIQAEEPGSLTLCHNRGLPSVLPGQVLVKTAAVALNPCDWKMPTNFPCPGAGVGSDYAGTVIALGDSVDRSFLKIGDRVAGAVHASNRLDPQSGAFAEYIAVWADQLWRVPDDMAWDEAAAIGWCVVGTVGLTIFRTLALPGCPEEPTKKSESGYRVITTCSPKNFGLVEQYGADRAFDYHSPTCAEDIRTYTRNSLRYVIDIIAEARTLKLCYAAIGRAGGHYVGFELIPKDLIADMRKTIKADWVLGIRMSGAEIALDKGYGSDPDPELRAWGCDLFKRLETILRARKIRSHPRLVSHSGLDGVISGVQRMRRREISGQKLVYLFESKIPAPPKTSQPFSASITASSGSQTRILPERQTALKIQGPGQITLQTSCSLPSLRVGEVLVRVICVAVNPEDWKSADMSPAVGATSGCDFAGVIVKVGQEVKETLCVDDRVCGFVFGNNPDRHDNGSFAEYVAAAADLIWKIPPQTSFEAASTLGVGVGTVGMALYSTLQLPLPMWPPRPPPTSETPEYVLVYGGGTATGGLAIQMIRMSGMIPITTCAPHNFDRVKSLGSAMAFDYNTPSCGVDIRTYTKGTLKFAFDCISYTESMKICYNAMGNRGGKYIALDHFPTRAHTRRDIHPDWMLLFTIFNSPINWKEPYYREARPQDREFGEKWFRLTQELLDAGAIVPPQHERSIGGLLGVIDGIDMVRKGRHNGVKLVYQINEPDME